MNLIQEMYDEIKRLEEKIGTTQEQCSHPWQSVVLKNKSATGDLYSADEYWKDMHCQLCDMRWTEDQ